MTYAERTLIIKAEDQALAQEICAAIAEGGAGTGMFTTALSSTGLTPATHYISNGPIATEFSDLLPLTTYLEEGSESRPANIEVIKYLALQAGLTPSDAALSRLLENVHVTDLGAIGAFEVLDKLGLKIVQDMGDP